MPDATPEGGYTPTRPDLELSAVVDCGSTRISFASRPGGIDGEDSAETLGTVFVTIATRTNSAGEPINEWQDQATMMLDELEAKAVLDLLALSIKNVL